MAMRNILRWTRHVQELFSALGPIKNAVDKWAGNPVNCVCLGKVIEVCDPAHLRLKPGWGRIEASSTLANGTLQGFPAHHTQQLWHPARNRVLDGCGHPFYHLTKPALG